MNTVNTDEFITLTEEDHMVSDCALNAMAIADVHFNHKCVQSKRLYQDVHIGKRVGVNKFNKKMSGWDGLCDNGVDYENKNNGLSYPNLIFRDTSDDKLRDLQEGVLCTSTGWVNSAVVGYILVGNTNMLGDLITKKFDIKNRRTLEFTLSECLSRGFKIAVGDFDKKKTIDFIKAANKHVGNSLTPNDILSQKELKQFAKQIVGM